MGLRGETPCSRMLNGPGSERPERFPGPSGRVLTPAVEITSYLQNLIYSLRGGVLVLVAAVTSSPKENAQRVGMTQTTTDYF